MAKHNLRTSWPAADLIRLLTVAAFGIGLLAAPPVLPAQTSGPAPVPANPLATARRLTAAKDYPAAIRILDSLVSAQPANGPALLALGNAHRGMGHADIAARCYEKAAALPANATPARLALFAMYADAGRSDDAFRWLKALERTVDLTTVAMTPGTAKLHEDSRFAVLFPDKVGYDKPFVEKDARIIHEWRGEAVGDEFGWIARGIGDVDGDGTTDVVISATANPPIGSTNGAIYVYSGKSGTRLWKHEGDKGALLGIGLESAGDVDGDGAADVVAGAPGINSVLILSGRDGHELLRLRGDSTDVNLGSSASGVGDIDGDGRADIVAGAPGSTSGTGAGRAYVFSGRDGHRLMTLDGERAGDGFGATVGGGGGQIIVGASGAGANSTGRVYVYRGADPKPIFVKDADATGAALGAMFVSVVGDVDGDGIPDIYASDFANAAKGRATGRIYVYSGTTGAVLLTATGDGPGEGFGIGPARTGDIDGDGRADLVIGSWQYGGAAWSGGRVRVLSSKDGRVLQTITGRVPGETLGFDAVGVGDIDGDGLTDFLVTSAWSMVNGIRSGRVYIVAGTHPTPKSP